MNTKALKDEEEISKLRGEDISGRRTTGLLCLVVILGTFIFRKVNIVGLIVNLETPHVFPHCYWGMRVHLESQSLEKFFEKLTLLGETVSDMQLLKRQAFASYELRISMDELYNLKVIATETISEGQSTSLKSTWRVYCCLIKGTEQLEFKFQKQLSNKFGQGVNSSPHFSSKNPLPFFFLMKSFIF